MGITTFHTTTGHQHRVAIGEVIPSQHLAFGGPALAERSATKLAAQYNESVIQEPSFFQIFD